MTFDIAIVGLGYVGLPTALAFHSTGHRVVGIDVSQPRIDDILRCEVDLLPADKKALQEALAEPTNFRLSTHPDELRHARTVIVCVPTPVDHHLVPDLSTLRTACETVVAKAVAGQTIVLTSTTYVGSTEDLIARPLAAKGLTPGRDIYVAFSPERIDPGNERHPHMTVPRVVGGVTSSCAEHAMSALGGYGAHLHRVSSSRAAEMTKLLENSFRAVNIALANEVADASRELGLDVREVINAASTKPFGFMPFFPGPGVGGHCVPCDPHYLLWQLRGQRMRLPVIEQAMSAIAGRPRAVVDRVREVLSDADRGVKGARILIVGVSYKPDVADLRESPAVEIMERLQAAGALVAFHDPLISAVMLSDGTVLHSETCAVLPTQDLVVVHTLHTDMNIEWLTACPLVLDATYRLDRADGRVSL